MNEESDMSLIDAIVIIGTLFSCVGLLLWAVTHS